MDLSTCSANLPYPEVKIEHQNAKYAQMMLSNMGGKNSEMTAISLYVYNSLIANGKGEIAEVFHKISIVEMHHLKTFGQLSLMLGGDPRLWERRNGRMQYWSASYNNYPKPLIALLKNSLTGEKEAIKKYKAQQKMISDNYIKAILERIILDEEIHVKIFEDLLKENS